ncbi:CSC1-like protein isoform X1 [Gossypium australe]|uniref:CSC1-like protein isoform X1 n=1 Tax=Gossypium australe TaxID=47621 RepID=A0A5B6VJ83_9ROSI|nr:CSC1-like protein isoform X1 [Gossypium australe]
MSIKAFFSKLWLMFHHAKTLHSRRHDWCVLNYDQRNLLMVIDWGGREICHSILATIKKQFTRST